MTKSAASQSASPDLVTLSPTSNPQYLSHSPMTQNGQSPFGAALEPVLRQVCEERLSAINWFRSDWQRGGAATGYAALQLADGTQQPVVVKLPVQPRERIWLRRLTEHAGDGACVGPRVFADGDTLAGYDIAWVVMERVEHGPIGPSWGGAGFDLVIQAAGHFYSIAEQYPIDCDRPRKDWEKILDMARQKVRRHVVHDEQRWSKALKAARGKLKDWLKLWHSRAVDQWCHGDLHLGNAMSRSPAPAGPAVLLDFAEVHPGSWIEDAVYFEHIYWSRRDLLDGRKLCNALARQRRQANLPVSDDWAELAQVRRALLAMSTPAMLEHEGDPAHVQAALEVLETAL